MDTTFCFGHSIPTGDPIRRYTVKPTYSTAPILRVVEQSHHSQFGARSSPPPMRRRKSVRRRGREGCGQCRLGSLFGKWVFSEIAAAKEVKRTAARRGIRCPSNRQSACRRHRHAHARHSCRTLAEHSILTAHAVSNLCSPRARRPPRASARPCRHLTFAFASSLHPAAFSTEGPCPPTACLRGRGLTFHDIPWRVWRSATIAGSRSRSRCRR